MLYGVYKAYRERGRPGLLILWGGLVDLGLALMGLGLGPSGDVGSIMIVIYHAIARLAAWIGLSGLVANPYSCVANDIRGALHRNPVGAVLLAFALEASLGISPAMTPEGQHLVLHAMAMHSIDVPLGGPVLAVVMALGNFADAEHIGQLLGLLGAVRHEGYYAGWAWRGPCRSAS